jgi:glycosyltransferase involved in cell wall biosynthesis
MNNINKLESEKKPLFSIGVTTYNRKDLLKQTIDSLLNQTFKDFEVIIGNDYPDEALTLKSLHIINDPRVRIINHKQNIGEQRNMNYLLSVANGRYFSWQFDDDPCSSILLHEVYSALLKYNYPQAVLTSFLYIYGSSFYTYELNNLCENRLYSGRDFLRSYLSGNIKALGCGGFYDTDYLKGIGGVHRLTNGVMAVYSEYLLIIKAGLLPEIAYINAPLVSCRTHDTSWSSTNLEVDLFKQAGINLLRESLIILSHEKLKDDFHFNLASILKSVISNVIIKLVMQNNHFDKKDFQEYVSLMREVFNPLKGTALHESAISSLDCALKEIPWFIYKAKLKMLIPHRYLKLVHTARSAVSRFLIKKAF